MFDRLFSIFRSREEKLFLYLLDHVKLSKECIDELIRVVEEIPNRDRLDEVARYIAALEKEADELTRKMDEEVVSGAIIPSIISDLELLLDRIDNVMDGIYFLSRELRRGANIWDVDPRVVEFLRDHFIKMLRITQRSIDILLTLLQNAPRNKDVMRSMGLRIEKLEEEVDDIKDGVMDGLYTLRDLAPVTFYHITTLTYGIDSILDNMKDVAVLVLTISNAISS